MGRAKRKTSPSRIRKVEDDKKEYICTCCGKVYLDQKRNFPASQSPLNAGNGYRLQVCRNCVDALFKHYTEVLGSEEAAIRRLCMKFDIYYNEELVSMSRKISLDRSRIMTYVSRANLIAYKGKTFDTTLDEEARKTIDSLDDLNEHNDSVDEESDTPFYVITQEDISNWGYGHEADEYQWLNDKYDEIKSTSVIDTITREELVRDYCTQKLSANKAMAIGKVDLYNKLLEGAQKTLDRANLTPKLEDASDKAGEKPIGVMIQLFEKERPIPKPRPEWTDVDGIVHLLTVYFIGHLLKMLGIKNRYSQMYEEEMAKYRAEIPDFNDETDDEDIFEYLSKNSKFTEISNKIEK